LRVTAFLRRGSLHEMKVGINILNFGPGAGPVSLARWAQFAEETGYHLVMISDHVAITPDVQAEYPAPFPCPLVSRAWLAPMTRRIHLGKTGAILPYRRPHRTPRLAANLDKRSG